MGILSIVGTPIGNLEDITLRGIRVLREADVIVCEDTRMTKRLLERYEIKDKQLTTYNEKATSVAISKIIEWLTEGKKIAVVTDAGTPGISDPGGILVQAVYEHIANKNHPKVRPFSNPKVEPWDGEKIESSEIKIEAIPGPSALATAISISGVPMARFTFLGFLPHKKGRETLFKEIASADSTYIFYESPHRILKTLEALKKFAPEKNIIIARELTKIYEEVVRGSAEELLEYFSKNPDKVRGEFVVIVN